MNRLGEKLTYSNVMVTILAILVLGGGTAYATARMLPKNSVGTRQIKDDSVTPAKLSQSAANSLRGPQGATGATGATGAQGPEGAAGPKGDTGAPGESAGPSYIALTAEEGLGFPVGKDHEVTVDGIKELPAGSYVISFSGDLFNGNEHSTEPVQVQCNLASDPGELGNLVLVGGIYTLPVPVGAEKLSSTATVSLESAADFTTDGGEVSAECQVTSGESEEGRFGETRVGIALQRMVATKVTGVSIQEFSAPGGLPAAPW
ncbi:MAG TPA: hypothetical protein VMH33_05345 [Solirubrobacterales bacterium]|nr:hypothetical protein [Solirubrobacterales bacterium]